MPKTETPKLSVTSAVLVDLSTPDLPTTAIAGWKPSKKQLRDMGYGSLPTLSKGKSYIVGADYLEWQQMKCASANLYIVDDADALFSIPEKCFERQVQAYHPGRAQIFRSGFSAVVGTQEESPDQTLSKTIPHDGEPIAVAEDEDSAEAYVDAETTITRNINRAFDLLGWAPATSCVCGVSYSNNCAHYLCNALIRAGFSPPNEGSNKKCPRGRLIRAMDVLKWCQAHKKDFSSNHDSLPSGTWIVFQQRSGGVQHVCMHKESPNKYRRAGTGDYENWPTQWHYRF